MMNRRRFLAASTAMLPLQLWGITLATKLIGNSFGSLVPEKPSAAPNYWCTGQDNESKHVQEL